MKLPRDLGGLDFVRLLCQDWGYRQIHQEGSHVILETEEPTHQRISIPAHRTLRVGTLNAIVRAVSRHKGVPRDAILSSLS